MSKVKSTNSSQIFKSSRANPASQPGESGEGRMITHKWPVFKMRDKIISHIINSHKCKSQTDWDCDVPCAVCNYQNGILSWIKKNISCPTNPPSKKRGEG